MKKFSTATRLLALASFFVPFAVLAAPTSHCEFLPDAPDQHKVARGDTLWGISGKFLKSPWCWPEVWGMNREEIRNPHWIYPGQIVYFDRVAGRLRLGTPAGSAASTDGKVGGDVHIMPQVRTQKLKADAISGIPAGAIEPFLSQPLIVEENELKDAPRIVATQEGRVYLGKTDIAYAMGELDEATSFQAFRPGKPLKDPETKAILGYEAVYLGTLKLSRAGTEVDEAHRLIVMSSKEEMGVGDHLIAIQPTPLVNYVPHPPDRVVNGRIVSVYGGVTQAGQNQIVAINRGKTDGLELGTVLRLSRYGQIIPDRTNGRRPVKLPDEEYGTLFIFRVFDGMAYGLVMQVTDTVQVGDIVSSPE